MSEIFVRLGDAGNGCIAATAATIHSKECPAARRRGSGPCECDAEKLWQEMFGTGQPWLWLAEHAAGAVQPEETQQ